MAEGEDLELLQWGRTGLLLRGSFVGGLKGCHDQLFLVSEMVIYSACAHLRPVGNLPHAGAINPEFRDDLINSAQQVFASLNSAGALASEDIRSTLHVFEIRY